MRSKPILLNLLVISFPLFFIWNCGPRKNDAIDTNTDSTVNHSSKVLAQVLASPDTNERQIQSGQFTFTFEPSTKKITTSTQLNPFMLLTVLDFGTRD